MKKIFDNGHGFTMTEQSGVFYVNVNGQVIDQFSGITALVLAQSLLNSHLSGTGLVIAQAVEAVADPAIAALE